LIGTGVGKSAAKGPSAQGRDAHQRRATPRSLLRIRWQTSMIVSARAPTSLGAECHSPRTQVANACVISSMAKASAPSPEYPPVCGGHHICRMPIAVCLFCNIPTFFPRCPADALDWIRAQRDMIFD
jgi:hypothetical protein